MIVIYSKPNCPHCIKAKGLVLALDLPHTVRPITPEGREEFAAMGMVTAPVIFRDEILVGGNAELEALLLP